MKKLILILLLTSSVSAFANDGAVNMINPHTGEAGIWMSYTYAREFILAMDQVDILESLLEECDEANSNIVFDLEEANRRIKQIRKIMFTSSIATVVIFTGIGFIFARQITK